MSHEILTTERISALNDALRKINAVEKLYSFDDGKCIREAQRKLEQQLKDELYEAYINGTIGTIRINCDDL